MARSRAVRRTVLPTRGSYHGVVRKFPCHHRPRPAQPAGAAYPDLAARLRGAAAKRKGPAAEWLQFTHLPDQLTRALVGVQQLEVVRVEPVLKATGEHFRTGGADPETHDVAHVPEHRVFHLWLNVVELLNILVGEGDGETVAAAQGDRKSTRLNSSH